MAVTSDQLRRGTQVAYIPTHANGHLGHKDVEYGFVTSVTSTFAFCRYWRKGKLGVLRTRFNSEATALQDLYVVDSVDQNDVLAALERWC